MVEDQTRLPLAEDRHRPGKPGVAIVTGGARRIGCAISRGLAREGWTVLIHYHTSKGDAERLAHDIGQSGGKAFIHGSDLSDAASVDGVISACIEKAGPPTCLINNASVFLDDKIGTLRSDIWDAHFATNLQAPIFLTQAFARHLPANASGNVINVIDQRVWNLRPDFFSYTLSKSTLWAATRTLAQALAPRIRVNAIGPGPVLPSIHQTEEEFAEEVRAVPLKRGAAPEEIASAINYILNAPAMTGQMIALDGGQHLV